MYRMQRGFQTSTTLTRSASDWLLPPCRHATSVDISLLFRLFGGSGERGGESPIEQQQAMRTHHTLRFGTKYHHVSKTTQGFKDRTDDFLAHQLKLEQEKLSSSTVQTTDAMLYLSRYAQRGIRVDGLSLINRPPNDADD